MRLRLNTFSALPPILALILSEGCNKPKPTSSVSSVSAAPCQPARLTSTSGTMTLTSGAHEFIFPDHRSEYKEGTVVLQPKDGRIYRCKRHPYSEYCKQWAHDEAKFEPGVGSNWMAAWDPL